MIITIFGLNGAVIGPLPYDIEECLFRASIRQAALIYPDDLKFMDTIVTPGDVKFLCVQQKERPQLEVE